MEGTLADVTPLVRFFMTSPVTWVRTTDPLAQAQRCLAERGISAVPVLDETERPVGVLSRFDLLRVGRMRARTRRGEVLLELPEQPVAKAMHAGIMLVGPGATVGEAAATLVQHHIHRVYVADGAQLVGVFSTRDVMAAVVAARVETPLADLMNSPVLSVQATDPISLATDRLAEAHVRGVVVLEGEWPVGMFTQTEALEARDMVPTTPVEQVMSYSMICLPPHTPLFRAAGLAAATRARRVLVVEHRGLRGILTGIDFARRVASSAS